MKKKVKKQNKKLNVELETKIIITPRKSKRSSPRHKYLYIFFIFIYKYYFTENMFTIKEYTLFRSEVNPSRHSGPGAVENGERLRRRHVSRGSEGKDEITFYIQLIYITSKSQNSY